MSLNCPNNSRAVSSGSKDHSGGARRGRLGRHYLLQGLLIGLASAILGVALGVLTTGLITSGLGVPDTVV